MSRTIAPRRSVLYMPGGRQRALEKARTLPADALILDLEDAVAPDEKPAARDLVLAALLEQDFGEREVIIRINGLDTPWGSEDLAMVCKAAPDAILVPKVESAETIRTIDARLRHGGAPEAVAIWAMMETPLGMLNAAEIAASSRRLTCFVLGTNDLVNDLHAEHTPMREPIVTALGLCLLAARAHGLTCLDGVYNAYQDDDGLRVACKQGRSFGFDGKTLIHPKQLPIANEVFAPSTTEVALAHRYIEAFEEAVEVGGAVAVVDGKIVENLHVENARRILAMAEAIAARETTGD